MIRPEDRAAIFHRDGHRCTAHGLHHRDCPGEMTNVNAGEFVPHHRCPRELGGSDAYTNLMTVWNGPTGLGAGGCHKEIHTDRRLARRLGHLLEHEEPPTSPEGDARECPSVIAARIVSDAAEGLTEPF